MILTGIYKITSVLRLPKAGSRKNRRGGKNGKTCLQELCILVSRSFL